MATTEEILSEAKKLGKLIKEHPAAEKLENLISKLQEDTEAQRVMNDYNRLTAKLAEKEQKGEPIEVDEKHQMTDLHKAVVMNRVLQNLQVAQMDYSDLLRQVDTAMTGEVTPPSPTSTSSEADESTAGQSPII